MAGTLIAVITKNNIYIEIWIEGPYHRAVQSVNMLNRTGRFAEILGTGQPEEEDWLERQ